jgi:hypothetical protein
MEATGRTQLVQWISVPIHQSKGWMKLLGGLSIVYGAVTALTIVGLVIAWLPIWIGILLYQSASLIERAYASGDENVLVASLDKLKTYFMITGILALIGLVLLLLGVALAFLGWMAAVAELG